MLPPPLFAKAGVVPMSAGTVQAYEPTLFPLPFVTYALVILGATWATQSTLRYSSILTMSTPYDIHWRLGVEPATRIPPSRLGAETSMPWALIENGALKVPPVAVETAMRKSCEEEKYSGGVQCVGLVSGQVGRVRLQCEECHMYSCKCGYFATGTMVPVGTSTLEKTTILL